MLTNRIYTFLKLCECMNYRVTAERLNMTQPAVTHHIQQLENEYNCKLFTYKNRVLYKTSQAHLLESYARSAEYNMRKLESELADSGVTALRIGATRTIGDYVAAEQLLKLCAGEHLELTYVVDNTDRLLEELRGGRLDFALIEGYLNVKEFSHLAYRREELVGICSPTHRFAGGNVNFEELFDERLILRESGSGTREAFRRIMQEHNRNIDSFAHKMYCNSFKVITELVAQGVGVSFVYESVANSTDNLARFRIDGVDSHHDFTCVYLKPTEPSPYMRYFVG